MPNSKSRSLGSRLSTIREERTKSIPSKGAIIDDIRHPSKYHDVTDYTKTEQPVKNKQKIRTNVTSHVSYRHHNPVQKQDSFLGKFGLRITSLLAQPKSVAYPHPVSSQNWNAMHTMKYPEIVTNNKKVTAGGKKKSKNKK